MLWKSNKEQKLLKVKASAKSMEWEKIFANSISRRGLITKNSYSSHQKKNNTFKKWAEDLNRHSSKDDIQMANRYMKRCLTLLIIREMQIKTTKRSHFMPAIQKTRYKCWGGCGEKGSLMHSWWEYKLVQALWRTVWKFLKIELPYDLTIPPSGVYLKKKKTLIRKDIYTPMFVAPLLLPRWGAGGAGTCPKSYIPNLTSLAQRTPFNDSPKNALPEYWQHLLLKWVSFLLSPWCPYKDVLKWLKTHYTRSIPAFSPLFVIQETCYHLFPSRCRPCSHMKLTLRPKNWWKFTDNEWWEFLQSSRR